MFFHVKALTDLLFLSNQMTQYFYCYVFLLSTINFTEKENIIKPFKWKLLFNSLKKFKIVKRL